MARKLLGQFDLIGIPAAPRGTPQIEVTFDIDANGIVNVSAKDKGTGKEQNIRIQASGGLSEEDIQRMVKDAEEHAAEDKKRKEVIEAKNLAESVLHTVEREFEEHRSKLGAGDAQGIEKAIADLREALNGDDTDAISAKLAALQTSAASIEQARSASSASEAAPGATPSDEIVDAEFSEVGDDEAGKPKG